MSQGTILIIGRGIRESGTRHSEPMIQQIA